MRVGVGVVDAKLMIRLGVIRMMSFCKTSSLSPVVSSSECACSAVPRISRHRTRQGSCDAMSSTTKATVGLTAMLRNF